MSSQAWDNDKWHFVAGVDHVTSSFFQVWRQPHEEFDCPVISANNQGIFVSNGYADEDEDGNDRPEWNLPQSLSRIVEDFEHLFATCRRTGIPYPNLDWEHADKVARACGFNITQELVSLYD
jgi:hypothetical protein